MASSLFGKIFGTGKDQSKQSERALAQQQDLASFIASQSQPVMSALSTRARQTLSGDFDPSSSPIFDVLKQNADSQFNVARDRVLSTVPGGGGLTSALTNLEGQRAGAISGGMADLYNQELSRAFALGTGQAPVALGGFGSVANTAAGMQAAQSAQQGQTMQGLGYAAGQYFGRGSGTTTGGKGSTGSTSTGSSGKSGGEAAATMIG